MTKPSTPPPDLAELFGDPPLALSESLEELSDAFFKAAKPTNTRLIAHDRHVDWGNLPGMKVKSAMIRTAKKEAVARFSIILSRVSWEGLTRDG